MRVIFRIVPLMLLLVFVPTSGVAQNAKHKVVFALTSADQADWNLTLGNIRNLLAGIPKDSVEVEVVAYGPGLSFVTEKSSAEAGIEELETRHVSFVACENSMKMQHVTAADLIPGVTTVASGVVEVIKREEQGWSYIKAGR